jgi:hypothetical protein
MISEEWERMRRGGSNSLWSSGCESSWDTIDMLAGVPGLFKSVSDPLLKPTLCEWTIFLMVTKFFF